MSLVWRIQTLLFREQCRLQFPAYDVRSSHVVAAVEQLCGLHNGIIGHWIPLTENDAGGLFVVDVGVSESENKTPGYVSVHPAHC